MHILSRQALALAAQALAATLTAPARADVSISSRATNHESCSAGVCTPTGMHANLNVTDLQGLLAASDVTVVTGSGAVDIKVIAALSWASASRLTLDANHSVDIKAPIVVAGPGALTLTTNDGGTGGRLSFAPKRGHVNFWDLGSSLIINGNAYGLAGDIATLASDIAADPAGFYALANRYDASADGTYLRPPIPTTFTGTFQGLGNTIMHLTIADPNDENVGLFHHVGVGGLVRDIRLVSAHVSSTLQANGENFRYLGPLVAVNEGTVMDAFSSGRVSTATKFGAGGLVGFNLGNVIDAHSTCPVSSLADGEFGGLVASSQINSNSTEPALIKDSSATGDVTTPAASAAGGLVGANNFGTIAQSFATGAVQGSHAVGGLLGANSSNNGPGDIEDSYATGSVNGVTYEGGLIGNNNAGAAVKNSYSSGAVTGSGDIGGLVGFDLNSFVADSYWDMTTSGIGDPSMGAGNQPNDPGITGLTDAQLKSGLPAGFSSAIWAEDPNINNGLPYLIGNPTP